MNTTLLCSHLYKALFVIACLYISGCASTTEAGRVGADRQQLLLLPSATLNAQAAQFYAGQLSEAKNKGKLNSSAPQVQRVRTIARRLIDQTEHFRSDAKAWSWEINVIDSPELNAYCTPGGKIAVYTGIIDKLKLTDSELAAIVGHEIAHALREHGRERASQKALTQVGTQALSAAFGLNRNLLDTASNLFLTLPNSREHEHEADKIGLELAARAGYDPKAAVSVWKKMQAQGSSSKLEFMSTHPSNENRIRELENLLPAVSEFYKPASANKVNSNSRDIR